MRDRSKAARSLAIVLAGAVAGTGCMAMTPQLPPTDFEELEQLTDRADRERAYAENSIYKYPEPQGTRFTKGADPHGKKRSWQSLDKILRSDASASAALPSKQLSLARLFTALTITSGIVAVAGGAASAREGLNLKDVSGPGAILLGGGIFAVAFGITAGIFYGKARKGYERAVEIYNDSLGMRLGVTTAEGEYIPPKGVLVDEEGFVVLDQQEQQYNQAAPQPQPQPKPEPEPEQPPAPAAEPTPPAANSPPGDANEPKPESSGEKADAKAPDGARSLSLRTRG